MEQLQTANLIMPCKLGQGSHDLFCAVRRHLVLANESQGPSDTWLRNHCPNMLLLIPGPFRYDKKGPSPPRQLATGTQELFWQWEGSAWSLPDSPTQPRLVH